MQSVHSGRCLWPPNRTDHYILPLWFLYFFFLFSSPILSGRRLDVHHTSTHDVSLLRIYNAGLKCAARGSLKTQDAKICHLSTIAQLCQAISSQRKHVLTIREKLAKQQYLSIFSTYRHNMLFGPLTAESGWRVWGTPANFNGFHVLASLFSRFDQQHSTEGTTYIQLDGHHDGNQPTL